MSLNADAFPIEQDLTLRGNEIQEVRGEKRSFTGGAGAIPPSELWPGRYLMADKKTGDGSPNGAPVLCFVYIDDQGAKHYLWHYHLNELKEALANLSLNNKQIENLAAGTLAHHAVNLSQLQAAELGLKPKDSVLRIVRNATDIPPEELTIGARFLIGNEAPSEGDAFEDHLNHIAVYDGSSWATSLFDSSNDSSMLYVEAAPEDSLFGECLIAYNGNLLDPFKWVKIYAGIGYIEGDAIELDGHTINVLTNPNSIIINSSNQLEVKLKALGGLGIGVDGHFVDIDNATLTIGEDGKIKVVNGLYVAGNGLTHSEAGGVTTFNVGGDGNASIEVTADGITLKLGENSGLVKSNGVKVDVDNITIGIVGGKLCVIKQTVGKTTIENLQYTGNGNQQTIQINHSLGMNLGVHCYRQNQDGTTKEIHPTIIPTTSTQLNIKVCDKIENFAFKVVILS